MRILIVEDEPDLLDALKKQLQSRKRTALFPKCTMPFNLHHLIYSIIKENSKKSK